MQAAVHRKLGVARRFKLACEMSEEIRAIALQRIRARHPEYGEAAVMDELVWELYGFKRQR